MGKENIERAAILKTRDFLVNHSLDLFTIGGVVALIDGLYRENTVESATGGGITFVSTIVAGISSGVGEYIRRRTPEK